MVTTVIRLKDGGLQALLGVWREVCDTAADMGLSELAAKLQEAIALPWKYSDLRIRLSDKLMPGLMAAVSRLGYSVQDAGQNVPLAGIFEFATLEG